ncbi:MAG: sugar ABC transporter permease [Clostridiales bacterium]|jgi:multiple sugar transport system permease protein|nr:sugar ABC transporter permease [Clostridiales bacterium]
MENHIYKAGKKTAKNNVIGALLASPPLIGLLLFTAVPLVFSLLLSFSGLKGFDVSDMRFLPAGELFANYKTVLAHGLFWKSLLNTLYAAAALPLSIVLALLLAQLLNQKLRGKKIFRTLYFIPFVCSIIALTQMWRMLLNTQYGILNEFFGAFGIAKINWLGDSKYFMPSMIVMGVWQTIGFNFILLSAALTNVNPGYGEAAKVDGAGAWTRFWRITLPALTPTLFYLLVMGLIASLQEFTRFQAINQTVPGGPDNAGLTVVYYMYRMSFEQNITYGMGPANAAAWLLTAVVMLITFLNFRLSKKWVSYD